MPVWPFNLVPTQDGYTDAVTCQFPIGRNSFSVQVYGAAVFYKLIRFRPPLGYYLDDTEHSLGPILSNFKDPVSEGLQPGELFGGIAFRSGKTTTPATVTVI